MKLYMDGFCVTPRQYTCDIVISKHINEIFTCTYFRFTSIVQHVFSLSLITEINTGMYMVGLYVF